MRLIVCCVSAVLALGCTAAWAERPILAVNEDNDHYFKLDADLMNEQALVRYVDRIVGPGHVTDFVMCPCGQRTSYDSNAWEPIWAGLNEPNADGRTNDVWCVNAKRLFDRGIDPYAVWIRRCREKGGVRTWMSMRMNDVHFVSVTNYFRNTTFHRTRRDLWRNPQAVPGKSPWEDMAFNYAKREVRDYSFALFKELVDRYDTDGYELDWMRFTRHLTPGCEREEAPVLTDFMRRCRAYADAVGAKRGRPILLSVRVQAKLGDALGRGCDVVAWADERLVDWIIATNFYETNDFDIDLEEWRRTIGKVNVQVKILPGASDNLDLGPDGRPVRMTSGDFSCWARRMYLRGAEGLYLFNVPYLPDDVTDFIYGGRLPRPYAK